MQPFAEQEFAKALGNEEIASRALYGLGRLEADPRMTAASSQHARAYRTMSLYQAALSINPANYAAANELGVLLARHGKTQPAIAALNQSVRYSPQPTVWHNLAQLYRQTGQSQLAQQAELQARQHTVQPEQVPYAAATPQVQWVQPEQFSRAGQPTPAVNVARLPQETPDPPAKPQQPTNQRWTRRYWPFK